VAALQVRGRCGYKLTNLFTGEALVAALQVRGKLKQYTEK